MITQLDKPVKKNYVYLIGFFICGLVLLLHYILTEQLADEKYLHPQPTYNTAVLSITPDVRPSITTVPPENSPSIIHPPISTLSSIVTTHEVQLSINGDTQTVLVPPDSNLYDVLSQALQQGKIRSLDMRFDNTYKSYAVYKINGQGKESEVWWVFTINGKSPSRGCNYIKVHDRDNVEWKYIGS